MEQEVFKITNLILEGTDPNSYGIIYKEENWRIYCEFFDAEYFGAAHGSFGVLYILLSAYKINKKYFDEKSEFTKNLI